MHGALPTFADEVLDALNVLKGTFPHGPMARDLAKHLAADIPTVREAMDKLEAEGRALIVRRGRALHLYPVGHDFEGMGICPVCRALFNPRRDSGHIAITCSRSCGLKWSWQQPGAREKRAAALKQAAQTPKAKARTAEHNRRRWSKPGEREKLAEQNRREWSDPVKNAKRSVNIQRVNGSPEMRAKFSEIKKKQWREVPEYREKVIAAVSTNWSKEDFRKKCSDARKRAWQDPEKRERYLAAARKNIRKAHRLARQKKSGASE